VRQRIGMNLWSRKKKSPSIIVALIAHHTQTSTWCHGTWWINVDFLQTRHPLRWNQASSHRVPREAPIHEIQACFMIRVMRFVNQLAIMDDCFNSWRPLQYACVD